VSLQSLILSLISEIKDPAIRNDIASTIYFIRDLYMDNKINDEQLQSDLTEIIDTVVSAVYPDLIGEAKLKKVEELTQQFMRAIKLETLRARQLRRQFGRLRLSMSGMGTE